MSFAHEPFVGFALNGALLEFVNLARYEAKYRTKLRAA
jgi:hypothetical protein